MATRAQLLQRYRLPGAAVAVSAALHAAVFVGMPQRIRAIEEGKGAIYMATLEVAPDPGPAPAAVAPVPPRATPAPARKSAPRKPRPKPRASPEAAALAALSPDLVADPIGAEAPGEASGADEARLLAGGAPEEPSPPEALPEPEVVAAAEPIAPPEEPRPDPFPVAALPAELSISYHLTSAFADGRAVYNWERDGDRYRISSEAEAEGFFTLFLEGQITQESRGTVSAAGLRPERFVERRPNAASEGLDFDWDKRQVTFNRGESHDTTALADNTVDWLSMIFQLAHVPPKGDSMDLQVFTQRRMYRFKLQVLGIEEIDIPLGRVRGLHLRHAGAGDSREVVDVWLGVDYHNLPVKMRFPVARNRLIVEQVATAVSAR